MDAEKEIIKLRIIEILKLHLLETISINQFREMTDVLGLGEANLKVRDYILKDAERKVNKMRSDDEFDLLEMFEKEA